MPAKNGTRFRHLEPAEKDSTKASSGGLCMLVTKSGSKLWRHGYLKQKLLAIGPYSRG